MRHRAEFSRYMSKGADINRGEPTKLRSAGATPNGMRGVIDPKNHASATHALPCRTSMFCVKGCRRRYRRTAKLATAGAPPLLDGTAADPVETSLPRHMYHNVKFGRSASNEVHINRTNPKFGERLGTPPCGGGVADPLEICPSPRVLSCRIWSF